MQDYFKSPIFVLGLPRSGTSMVAGALERCGAWVGTTVNGGGPENPRGFFEHRIIREHVTKRLLEHIGCDPLGVTKLPAVNLQGEIPDLGERIRGIIEMDGYANDRPWLYKDAKLTLLWPVYRKAFPSAKWVVVSRDEQGIINSCLRTSFMKQHSNSPEFWKEFVDEYLVRIEALKRSGVSVMELSSPAIIEGKLEEFSKLVEWLGLAYREKELRQFILPSRWHGTSGQA